MTWRNRSACLDESPELFFPIGDTRHAVLQIEAAKTVCRRCTVAAIALPGRSRPTRTKGCGVGCPRPGATAVAAFVAVGRGLRVEAGAVSALPRKFPLHGGLGEKISW